MFVRTMLQFVKQFITMLQFVTVHNNVTVFITMFITMLQFIYNNVTVFITMLQFVITMLQFF